MSKTTKFSQNGTNFSIDSISANDSDESPSESALSTLDSISTAIEGENSTNSSINVSMVTPWKQECGNAEYAERLCVAINRFANITPIDLRNFSEDFELRSRIGVKKYFRQLIADINRQESEIVHLQHEYCFFGRSIQRSNCEFLRFTQRVKRPIVVTLHTWLESSVNPTRKLKSYLKNPVSCIREMIQRKDYYKALCNCKGIVVHSHETYTQLVSTYPKLRDRVRIIQIPISPVDSGTKAPPIEKENGDVWMLLPGFVSPYKGHSDAINVLEHLPEHLKLVIAGGRHPKDRGAARYWMELLQAVETKGLQERVIFTGFLATGSEQASVLKQADLFILPYKEVGQSGSAVLADALAYDRPVVTSRARSMFAYRMSQDCVYSSVSTDVTNPKSFAELIVSLLENKAEHSHLASNRVAAIERYSLESIGAEYKKLYSEVRSQIECKSA